MEGLMVVFLFIMAIISLIILSKINSLSRNVTYMDEKIKELLKRTQVKKYNQKTPGTTQSLKDDTLFSEFAELIEPDKKPTEDIISQEKEEPSSPIVPEVAEVTTETVKETIMETPQVEGEEDTTPEETPAYAAFSNNTNKSQTSFPEVSQQPSISQSSHDKVEKEEFAKDFIEKIFGENLLTKIGIVTLILGIAFFVKYAIDQDWINETGRVGIGLLTGGIIIGIAHKLKERYQVFSSILVGGGISVLYITITLAFREYKLFSQPLAFGILIVITIFSVILSLFYDRKELAIFSLLGGFASPLMISSGSGNYVVLFSYILILNTGMLVLAFRKKWHVIGIISYVLTLTFFWSWLLASFENQFKGTTVFATLFFVQFYTLALIDHFKGDHKISLYQIVLILTNNLSLFLACLTIFAHYQYDIKGLITISMAAVNAVIMIALFLRKQVDRNLIYLIIGVVMTFVNLAIPIQLDGYVITIFWAVEMAILLWLWQKSQIQIFRIGFIIVTGLTIISYLMDILHSYYTFTDTLIPILFNSVCITGLVIVVSFFVCKLLLRKEDKGSIIFIGDLKLFSVDTCSSIISLVFIGLIYLVPFLELNYQIEYRIELNYNTSLRYMVMVSYTSVYVSILTFLYRKEIAEKPLVFEFLSVFTIIYSLVYCYCVIQLRNYTFLSPIYPKSYFLLHFIAFILLMFLIITLIRNVKTAVPKILIVFYWCMTIISTFLLSIETENISVMFFSNSHNYSNILYDVRTFVFPVLWALIAIGIMIWGLRSKEVILRKISLIFFALIIIKFYVYDVWYMSQTGRIISFIMLGIIILLASFLQQKIKTLVKEDVQESDTIMNNEQ